MASIRPVAVLDPASPLKMMMKNSFDAEPSLGLWIGKCGFRGKLKNVPGDPVDGVSVFNTEICLTKMLKYEISGAVEAQIVIVIENENKIFERVLRFKFSYVISVEPRSQNTEWRNVVRK